MNKNDRDSIFVPKKSALDEGSWNPGFLAKEQIEDEEEEEEENWMEKKCATFL